MTGRGRGAVRSETARLAILHATATQLAERGWNQLTIEGIATTARVGKPTIYRWWPSKYALVADALLEGLLASDEPLPGDSGDLRADLLAWLEPTLRVAADDETTAMARYLIAAGAEDAVIGHRLDATSPISPVLAARLARAQADGILDSDADVSVIAEALLGVVMLRLLRRTPYVEGDARTLIDTVVMPRSGVPA